MMMSLHLFLILTLLLNLFSRNGILLALYHVMLFIQSLLLAGPPDSVVKFNFDSAFNFQAKIATSGVLGRNACGLIMAACSVSHRDVADAFITEALACKQVVVFARDMGFSSVIIKGDSLTVMKKLNTSNSDKSIISPIVHDIKVLARDFDSISFRFVRRDANNAAHVLAREFRFQQDPLYWIEEAPQHTTIAVEMDIRKIFPLPGS
ncbi:hypothetical protein V6N11_080332 [Hibiscus sabdariffa]|uniref:RNase H type-1 domain-containing protein n=1 Tax=Hibiscus sabdariffa TaxID=183260 RepID=A0ABR2R7Q4_9ROSI